jgi:hypothetical protein
MVSDPRKQDFMQKEIASLTQTVMSYHFRLEAL